MYGVCRKRGCGGGMGLLDLEERDVSEVEFSAVCYQHEVTPRLPWGRREDAVKSVKDPSPHPSESVS